MSGLKNCGTFTEWNKYYAAETKKDIIPFTIAFMELETIKLSEII